MRSGAEIGGVAALDPDEAKSRAQPHIDAALALAPLASDSLEAKWRLQLSRNDCAGAERTLETALAHYPSNAAAQYQLYQSRCCQGKWIAAFESARNASLLDPFDDQYAMDYASTLILLNRYDEAERVWRRILELQPERSTGYRGLGHYNRFQGKLAAAQDWYAQALEINPDLIWNRLYAARNLLDMGLFDAARALYPDSHRWELFFAQGEFDRALAALTSSRGEPDDDASHDEIAEILSAQKRFDESRALLEGYAAKTEGTIGPLFADFPELDIPAPHLVYLRRRDGDAAGVDELAALIRVFIAGYRDGGGDDYLLDVHRSPSRRGDGRRGCGRDVARKSD